MTQAAAVGGASASGVGAEVGIGLRQPHCAALMQSPADLPLDFVEVHSENFFADGGASIAMLRAVRERHDVSLHGVGLSLGSAAGLDPWHLDRLARLVKRIDPVRVSDHASFARSCSGHANDLLPIAFTDEALRIMSSNVTQVQERIARPMLVENLSSYLSFSDARMSEPEFFTELCKRSGCCLLLDVNNLMVNALNADAGDPFATCCAFIDALPRGIVGELHVAGFCETDSLVIDDHGSRVRPAVWALLAHALRRFGRVPTLVEWDTNLPAFDVLLDEARHAGSLMEAEAA